MIKFLMACCLCLFIAIISNGCITRTTTSKDAINATGTSTNKNGIYITEQTLWIWQKDYWSH